MDRMERLATSESRDVMDSLAFAGGQAAAARPRRIPKISPLIPIFVFALAMPMHFYLGPTRLSPYRLVLVLTFIPCLMAWLSGSVGRIRLPDIWMLLAAIWGAVILVSVHGIDQGL